MNKGAKPIGNCAFALFLRYAVFDTGSLKLFYQLTCHSHAELVREEFYIPVLFRIVEEKRKRNIAFILFDHFHQFLSELCGKHRCGDSYRQPLHKSVRHIAKKHYSLDFEGRNKAYPKLRLACWGSMLDRYS